MAGNGKSPMMKLVEAVYRRNRQAEKVEALVDRVYVERLRLAELDRAVGVAHQAAPEGTMIGYRDTGWEVHGPSAREVESTP